MDATVATAGGTVVFAEISRLALRVAFVPESDQLCPLFLRRRGGGTAGGVEAGGGVVAGASSCCLVWKTDGS